MTRRSPPTRPSPSVEEIVGAIWVAAAIGSEEAMHAIARFGADGRVPVIFALTEAWRRFDPISYAKSALADSPLRNGYVAISDTALIPALPYLRNMRKLDLSFAQPPAISRSCASCGSSAHSP